jgi:hypothetical protein
MKKETRGGFRANAGRKKVKGESVSLNLNIDKKVAEAMKKHFKGDVSALTENYYKQVLEDLKRKAINEK